MWDTWDPALKQKQQQQQQQQTQETKKGMGKAEINSIFSTNHNTESL